MSDEDTQLMSFLRRTEFHTTDEHLPGWNNFLKIERTTARLSFFYRLSQNHSDRFCCLSRNNDMQRTVQAITIPAEHSPRSK